VRSLTRASADRLIEGLIVAGLGYMAYQLLSGMPFHPVAADAPSVSTTAALVTLRSEATPVLSEAEGKNLVCERSGGRSETRFLVLHGPKVAGCKVLFRGQ